MEDALKFKHFKGKREVFPAHPMVGNWVFPDNEEDEAALAHQMAVVAEKHGLNANDLQYLFPAVLRMLKSQSAWTK